MLPGMTALASFDTAMAADDTYTFPHLPPGFLAVVELSGGFDSGTATLGFINRAGAFTAFKDASAANLTATAANAWEVRVPNSGTLALTLSTTAAGAATLKLTATVINA